MLIAAFGTLSVAIALGTALAVVYLRREGATLPWRFGAFHGLVGIGGLCCLVLALRGPPRGVEQGIGSFGAISAVLISLAALVGLAVLSHLLKRRRAGTLIGLHATLAVSGFVILAAYLLA